MTASQPHHLDSMNMENAKAAAPARRPNEWAADKNMSLKKERYGSLAPQSTSPEPMAAVNESSEESSTEGNDTDSESESDGNEEQPRAKESREDNAALQPGLTSGASGPERPRNPNRDENTSVPMVPPGLLGEIRRMIQLEFGMMKTARVSEQPKSQQPKTDSHQPERAKPITVTSSSSRPIPNPREEPNTFQGRPRSLSISPRRRHPEPTTSSPALAGKVEWPVVSPVSQEKQAVVRFADERPGMSVVDEKWGVLFDDKGFQTKRLEQVLKGIANYIIDEFMPQRSLVIPPEKMAAFYSLHKLENEAYPFVAIFKCRTKGWNLALGDMYQDLGCEYYLIQKDNISRPSVPALTPAGFAKWMTTSILAYPDTEAKRLGKIVSELPINADSPGGGVSERLPKQISRHLFPEKHDRRLKGFLDDVVAEFTDEFLPFSLMRSFTAQQQRPVPPKAAAGAEKREPSPRAPGPRDSRYPLFRTESTPSPRTSTFDDQQGRDHAAHKSARDSYDRSHDSHGRARHDSPPAPAPVPITGRPGRANPDSPQQQQRQPSIAGKTYSTSHTETFTLPPPPVGTSRLVPAMARRQSSPIRSFTRRRDLDETGDVVRDLRDREIDYHHHAPRMVVGDYTPRMAVGDYTPRSVSGLGVSVPSDRAAACAPTRRGEGERDGGGGGGGGNPGPTWDEYLTGRRTGSSPRSSTFSAYSRGSV